MNENELTLEQKLDYAYQQIAELKFMIAQYEQYIVDLKEQQQ